VIARARRSLVLKLFAGELLVILAGALTLLLVAVSLGPTLFHDHIREALGYVPEDVARHLDMAYDDATLVSLGIAVGAAVVAALAVNLLVSIRIVQPVRALATAARHVAGGAYEARVPAGGTDEIGALAGAFNEMAASLEASEERRRELLSDVAHELRTPVATIGAYVEGIVDGVVAPDADVLGTLKAETVRLARLVEDLQKVSRAEERQLDLKLVRVRPDELLEAAIQAADHAFAANGVQLRCSAEHHLPEIAVDRDRIGEVLANLLENALRHTPPGGSVDLTAARRDDQIELTVSDSGEGIPTEHLNRVFERFYRVDRARSRAQGGSGIGLAIARAIVEAHGGSIHAESDGAGHGARFVIALPVSFGLRAG
jgi:two-component system sensor histidine kinase BaeS